MMQRIERLDATVLGPMSDEETEPLTPFARSSNDIDSALNEQASEVLTPKYNDPINPSVGSSRQK